MRRERSMRTAAILIVGVVGLTATSACRDDSPEPIHNRNLGDKEGELMPVGVAPADARILQDQKGVEQEEFNPPSRARQAKRSRSEEDEPEEGEARPRRGRAAVGRTGKKPSPAAPKGGALGALLDKAKEKDAKPGAAKSAPPGKQTPKEPAAPARGPAPKKGAEPKRQLPKHPSAKGSATKQAANVDRIESSTGDESGSRSINSLTLKMSPPWKPWQPGDTRNLIAAYRQKGVGDVRAWSIDIPKNIKPEMLNTEVGRFAMAGKVKQAMKKHFKQIDKWTPGSKTVVIDGVQAIEAGCTLKKGPIAGVQAAGEGVCFGIVGKTKAFLVVYAIPADGKQAAAVRKAVLAAVKLSSNASPGGNAEPSSERPAEVSAKPAAKTPAIPKRAAATEARRKSESPTGGVTVYGTLTGKKYHSAGCRHLRRSRIPMSLKDAKSRGLTPCSACGPSS